LRGSLLKPEAAFDAIGRYEVAVGEIAGINREDDAVRHPEGAVDLAEGETGGFKIQ
jgi:hypothetical protein